MLINKRYGVNIMGQCSNLKELRALKINGNSLATCQPLIGFEGYLIFNQHGITPPHMSLAFSK
jgi:hypothetical protein